MSHPISNHPMDYPAVLLKRHSVATSFPILQFNAKQAAVNTTGATVKKALLKMALTAK